MLKSPYQSVNIPMSVLLPVYVYIFFFYWLDKMPYSPHFDWLDAITAASSLFVIKHGNIKKSKTKQHRTSEHIESQIKQHYVRIRHHTLLLKIRLIYTNIEQHQRTFIFVSTFGCGQQCYIAVTHQMFHSCSLAALLGYNGIHTTRFKRITAHTAV